MREHDFGIDRVPSNSGGEPEPLVLPAADAPRVAEAIADAPVCRWFRALVDWAEPGRVMEGLVDARVPHEESVGLIGLLGLDTEGDDGPDAHVAAAVVDVPVRWALGAGLLRLRTGVVRPTKQGAAILEDPAALWFRALCALRRPNEAFTTVLRDLGSGAFIGHDVVSSLGDLVKPLAVGPLDVPALGRAYATRWGENLARPDRGEVEVLMFLARSLGLITRDRLPSGEVLDLSASGRVFHALNVMPFRPVADVDDPDAPMSLVAWPDEAEPGFTVRVNLDRPVVWRRMTVPGELTLYGLHLAIQAAFGWDGDHLHVFEAGPFRFAANMFGLDGTAPAELVTLTDLSVLGISQLEYEYDLGDRWRHVIVVERTLPAGSVIAVTCTAGAGTTPAEDGADMYEDDEGDWVPDPDAVPDPERVYDLERINRALVGLAGEGGD